MADHFEEAERVAARARHAMREQRIGDDVELLLASAQISATLALTEAVRDLIGVAVARG